MNKYLETQREAMDSLVAQADAETDPHRQAILRNYYRHMSLEISGRWDEFVYDHDTMMAEHPEYIVKFGTPDTVLYHGIKGVEDFYNTIDQSVVMLQAHETAVADWGFSSRLILTSQMTGAALTAAGMTSADIGMEIEPDAVYAMEDMTVVQFWRYDSRARLTGEELYQVDPPKAIVKVDPENIATKQDVNASLKHIIG